MFVVNSDGSSTFTGTGGTVLVVDGVLTFLNGRVVESFDPAGNLVSQTITGSTQNLCTLLAGP